MLDGFLWWLSLESLLSWGNWGRDLISGIHPSLSLYSLSFINNFFHIFTTFSSIYPCLPSFPFLSLYRQPFITQGTLPVSIRLNCDYPCEFLCGNRVVSCIGWSSSDFCVMTDLLECSRRCVFLSDWLSCGCRVFGVNGWIIGDIFLVVVDAIELSRRGEVKVLKI